MQPEPSELEGPETSVPKSGSFPKTRSVDRTAMPSSAARWAVVLVALGLLAGFAVGSRIGSDSSAVDPQLTEALAPVAAPGEYELASISDEPIELEPGKPGSDPEQAQLALFVGPEFVEPKVIASQVVEAEVGGRDNAQSLAQSHAQNDGVSIADLPVHESIHEFDYEPSRELVSGQVLTIVTRGEIAPGESLGSSLRRQNIEPSTVHLIAREMRKVFDFRRSRPGDRYRLGQDADGRVLDFRYSQSPEESFYLAWEGTRYTVRKETAELRPQIAKIAGVVDSSFYGAIMALGEQSALASEFARIFAWDIDFSRNVQPGDEFSILYERLYRLGDDGEEVYVRPGRVLAGRYKGLVGEHTVVYFEDESGGAYFRPDGSSVERAFLAAPLQFSRISSRFTRARRHPILKVTRPHPGIDYAAAEGTPIYAVSDGVVEYRARAGASGNLIRIRHAGGYTSHYAHLARFEKGLNVGDKVEQREVIGYVGSTGLSTGPHVCFRVKKDGRYVDPMKISSPAGSPVDRDRLEDFHLVRDQLLADLGRSSVNLADDAL